MLLVSGAQLSEPRLVLCHRLLPLSHSYRHHFILLPRRLHRLRPLSSVACTSNHNPTHSHRPCLLSLDTKPHRNYRHLQHMCHPRLRSSHRVCGVIPSRALMILEHRNGDGTEAVTPSTFFWTVPSRSAVADLYSCTRMSFPLALSVLRVVRVGGVIVSLAWLDSPYLAYEFTTSCRH